MNPLKLRAGSLLVQTYPQVGHPCSERFLCRVTANPYEVWGLNPDLSPDETVWITRIENLSTGEVISNELPIITALKFLRPFESTDITGMLAR